MTPPDSTATVRDAGRQGRPERSSWTSRILSTARGPNRIVLPGTLSAGIYAYLALGFEATSAVADVAKLLAAAALLFALALWAHAVSGAGGLARRGTAAILLFAALFRLLLLFAGLPLDRPRQALRHDLSSTATGYDTFLLYDNDVWRYLWDGHVVASGRSPYVVSPGEALGRYADDLPEPLLDDRLWLDVLENVSFRSYTTVYPPVAQGLFALGHAIAPGSVFLWKLIVALFDLGSCWLLLRLLASLGQPLRRALWYAWNPLVVKEFAGSGHVDAVMVFFLLLGFALLLRGRAAGAHAGLALAVMTKVGAAALAPFFLLRSPWRSWWALPATLAVLAAPFAADWREALAGLRVYGDEWVFNSGPWLALRVALEGAGVEPAAAWAHAVTKLALAALLGFLLWRRPATGRDLARASFLLLAWVIVLHPAVMPWYLAWALPFALLCGNRSWIVLTGLALLSYLFYADPTRYLWWVWIEFGLFFGLWALEELGGAQAPSTT